MRSRKHITILFALVATFAATASFARPSEPVPLLERSRAIGVMGTDLKITALGPDGDALDRAIDSAFAEIRRVEDVMTDWRPSPLTRLNEAAGSGPVVVPAEVTRLTLQSLEISRITSGAFDPTFASVGSLWKFKHAPEALPDVERVRALLRHVGWQRVGVDLEATTVELPKGTRLGFGGIAKGYGVDRAMSMLRRAGIEHAMVNAGGDLKALGRKHGEPWQIAIKHPRDRERVIAVLPVVNQCVVTSGDYERFFELDGVRYHHIIDPRTGYPSTGCMSATIIAPEASVADALATALCVLRPEEGIALIEKIARVEAITVGLDGEVRTTSGLRTQAAR